MPSYDDDDDNDNDDVDAARLPSLYFIFVLALLLLFLHLPPNVFHCRPLFRLLLLTSFVRTSLQRKKGEKGCAHAMGEEVQGRRGNRGKGTGWKFRFAR